MNLSRLLQWWAAGAVQSSESDSHGPWVGALRGRTGGPAELGLQPAGPPGLQTPLAGLLQPADDTPPVTAGQYQLWNYGKYDVQWEEMTRLFMVEDFKVKLNGCVKLKASEACDTVRRLHDVPGLVMLPEELEKALVAIKKCNTENVLNSRVCVAIGYEFAIMVPSLKCENRLWGFDLGFNLGDYGMEMTSNTIYGNWTDIEFNIILNATAVTLPLGSRSSYVYDLETYSGLPGPFMERPSARERCAYAKTYGRRSGLVDGGRFGAMRGVKLAHGNYEGTTFFESPYNLNNRLFKEIRIHSRYYHRPSKSQIPRIPLFYNNETDTGIKFGMYRGVWNAGPNCKAADSSPKCSLAESGIVHMVADFDYSTFLTNLAECIYWNELNGQPDCSPHFEMQLLLPLNTYGVEEQFLGFDLGVSLGDYGLEIRDNTVYINTPAVDGFPPIAALRTVSLAPLIPNLDSFGYTRTSEPQRIALAYNSREIPVVNSTAGVLSMGNVVFYGFRPQAKDTAVHGTTLIAVSDPLVFSESNAIIINLVRAKTLHRTAIPDLRDLNPDVPP